MIYLLAREGSGSLDVRGFARRQTTRRSCPVFQYILPQQKSYFITICHKLPYLYYYIVLTDIYTATLHVCAHLMLPI